MLKGQVLTVQKVEFKGGKTFYKTKVMLKIDEEDILIEKFCMNELKAGQVVQVALQEDSESSFKKIAIKYIK